MFEELKSKIGFSDSKIIVKSEKTQIYIFEGLYNKQRALLKVIPLQDVKKIQKQKKEIAVSQLIESSSCKRLKHASVLAWGEHKGYFWLIRSYIDGDSLSGTRELNIALPLRGYDYIKQDFVNSKKSIIKDIRLSLIDLRKIDSKSIKPNNKRFIVDINLEEIKNIKSRFSFNLINQLAFYESVKKEYLLEKNQASCMGDLVPANIIINKIGQVYLTDFEYFCEDNYMVDSAFLWLYLWRYDDWQKELTVNLNNEEKIFFCASVVRIVLPTYLNVLRSDDKSLVQNYLSHKWAHYLENCQSFGILTKSYL